MGWLSRAWGEFVGPQASAVENSGTLAKTLLLGHASASLWSDEPLSPPVGG